MGCPHHTTNADGLRPSYLHLPRGECHALTRALCLHDMFNHRRTIIFDGVCNFSNGAVRFISKRDPRGLFVFTPMQSKLGKELIEKHKIENVGVDTFLLIKNGKTHIWTDAAMEIAKELSGAWWVFNILRIIPAFVRDYFYRLFARNRYRLFGRTDECVVPSEDIKSRFIGIET